MRRTALTWAAVGLLVLAGGCATAELSPSASVTTLMPDSERWFRLSWEAAPDAGDTRRLRGYVENAYGEAAGRIQLLGQALDSDGNVVGQRIEWLPFTIGGFGRAYFAIPRMPQAEAYRVTVWSYERIQGRDGGGIVR